MHGLIEAVWFLIPAGIANMVPVLAARLLPRLDRPVDFGLTVRGRRLFGSHKTWRGLVTGVAAAAATFVLQQALARHVPIVREYGQFDYVSASWMLGAGLGAAALTGDLVKSAIKRQLDIEPGRAWFPFDQVDWLLGTIAFAYLFLSLPGAFVAQVLIAGVALHLAGHFLGYLLGFNATRI